MTYQSLRIIITGASSGIGRAIALDLAKDQNQHQLFITGRNEKRIKQVASEVQTLGSTVSWGTGDVGDEHDVNELFSSAIDNLEGIDVLIANAGVGHFGPLEDIEVHQFDEQFQTNVRGVFLWIKKVLPRMKKQNSGQIVVISSMAGFNTNAGASVYCATKHALQGLVGGLRNDLTGTNVKASTINPGGVNTPWFDGRDVDRSKMLSAEDVAKATRLVIEQSDTSNIDAILLSPAKE